MKRLLDISMALVALFIFIIPMMVIAISIICTSRGPIIYWSDRVGRNNLIFRMPKFRTMKINTPEVASNLLVEPAGWITPVGSFLRKSSLDETPQFWSILKGEMSFVGPRPALYNQYDLISLRTQMGVSHLRPGLTGWAQINGRDELSIIDKVRFDAAYAKNNSLLFDIKIIYLTLVKLNQYSKILH